MSSARGQVNRAIVYSEPGISLKTHIVELPIPEPGQGEVLVRLSYSGVCHTDIGFCLNQFRLPNVIPPGQIGGHEGVGVVVSLGLDVTSFEIGSHVGIKYAADACLSCDRCTEGGESSCRNTKISGYFTPGTFQQYCLATARYLTPIPDALDLSNAGPLMCGGVTVYTGLKRAKLAPGQWVVVCGAGGGLGHLGIQYAKAMGGRVLALDIGSKEEFCTKMGADKFLDIMQFSSEIELADELKHITSGGCRIVLMCASSAKAYGQSMSWLGFRGTLVCLGIPNAPDTLKPDVMAMVSDEQRIIGIKSGNRVDMQECLEIAAQGRIQVYCQIRKMHQLTQAFEDIESGMVEGRVVIDLA